MVAGETLWKSTPSGGNCMAYETKVILKGLANQISMAKSVKQAYKMVKSVAEVEGLKLPTFEESKMAFTEEDDAEQEA